jgi:hypothetical protein
MLVHFRIMDKRYERRLFSTSDVIAVPALVFYGLLNVTSRDFWSHSVPGNVTAFKRQHDAAPLARMAGVSLAKGRKPIKVLVCIILSD